MAPRTARKIQDGGTYHVMTRGNNGHTLFHHELDFQRYLEFLLNYTKTHNIAIRHFVLMPDHVHLLLRVTRAEALSKAMLGINLSYSLHYRRQYAYTGHLWEGRFKTKPIDPGQQSLECARYIELHPIRAGLALVASEYPWSSYLSYAQGAPNNLLTLNPSYTALAPAAQDRQRFYREFIQQGVYDISQARQGGCYGLLGGPADPIEEIRRMLGFPSGRRRKLQSTIEE